MSRRYDHYEPIRSMGEIPVQDAAEPLEHMTETYAPEQEEADNGPTDEDAN
jgi:hypothetical protein